MNEDLSGATVAEPTGWENMDAQGGAVGNTSAEMVDEVADSRETETPQKARFTETEPGVYKVEGLLTEENIDELNALRKTTTFVLDSTVGLSSELLRKINSDKVFFSVKGGLDYEKKSKFDTPEYRKRTMMSPKGLERAVYYFEHVEEGISPEWDEVEKAMYLYNCLAVDVAYGEAHDELMDRGVAARGLNGLMYGELVCSGFAYTMKEMMERSGIECHYQNQQHEHAYNVLKLNGAYYGIDVTWEKEHGAKSGSCGFRNFGSDAEFYERNGHRNYVDGLVDFDETERWVYDEEEERFPLSTFTIEELKAHYQKIAPVVEGRQNGIYQGFLEQPREVRERFLPIEHLSRREFVNEANRDYENVFMVMDALWSGGDLRIDERLQGALLIRNSYVKDMREKGFGVNHEPSFGAEALARYERTKSLQSMVERGVRSEFGEDNAEMMRVAADELNAGLMGAVEGYLDSLVDDADELTSSYEKASSDDEDSPLRHGNIYTKLAAIVGAKEYLVERGRDAREMEDICTRIQAKFDEVDG